MAALQIGPQTLSNNLILAPMAGVTDLPFRKLCRRLGAGLTVSEMVHSNPALAHTDKTRLRQDHRGEPGPIAVQIAGADPAMIADSAARNVALGAQIIDINMGCPAKKVCNKRAGSALLEDEQLVKNILQAAVAAVDVPVTLKIRTGPSPERRNGERIAAIAEDAGLVAISVHGRTRACAFKGAAEYETIRRIKRAVTIPVIANGDITTPEQAKHTLQQTGADAIMIGRAAQGNPWIFRQIQHFLETGNTLAAPSRAEVGTVLLEHVTAVHRFYGEARGLRVARKHIGWYLQTLPGGNEARHAMMKIDDASEQLDALRQFFHGAASQTNASEAYAWAA